MQEYKNLLFDWDGTIVRTLDIWHNALKVSLEKYGYFLSDQEIGANFELLDELLKKKGVQKAELIISEAAYISALNLLRNKPYLGSFEALINLKESGKKLALVTTSVHSQVDPLLKNFRIEELFDIVVCGDDVKYIKPDAEPIIKAMNHLQAKSNDTVMIGDSEKDIESANNAGIDSILFYPKEHAKFYSLNELNKLSPTITISSFIELLHLFN